MNEDSVSFMYEFYKLEFERCMSELQCFYRVELIEKQKHSRKRICFCCKTFEMSVSSDI